MVSVKNLSIYILSVFLPNACHYTLCTTVNLCCSSDSEDWSTPLSSIFTVFPSFLHKFQVNRVEEGIKDKLLYLLLIMSE